MTEDRENLTETAESAAAGEDETISAVCGWPPRERPVYSTMEQVAAVLCLLIGYWLVRWVLPGGFGIGTALCFGLLFLVAGLYGRSGGRRLTAGDRLRGSLLLVFTLPFVLFPEGVTLWLNLPFLMAAIVWCVYQSGAAGRGWRPLWPVDLMRSLISRPFASLGHGMGAAGSLIRRLPCRKGIGKALGGLLLALPLTLLVGGLLTRADEVFAGWMERLLTMFQELPTELPAVVLRLGFALPIALYLFGMLYAAAHDSDDLEKRDGVWEQELAEMRRLSPGTLAVALTPVCLLYLLFFAAQSAYHLSAFQNYLPAGFTYADYARRGFFELCAVALINLGLLALLYAFSRREEGRLSPVVRGYGAVLCLMTLLLIAVALRKMLLYIDRYGLTPLRLYTSWFMALLALLFLLIGLSLLVRRLRTVKAAAIVCVLMFGLLQFVPVDGLIARYNVTRYQEGTLPTVDVALLDSLSDAAIPYMAELLSDDDPVVAAAVRTCLQRRQEELGEQPAAAWNLTSFRMRRLLDELLGERQ